MRIGATLLAVWLHGACAAQPQYSELWGKDGENWSPDSRLPDFSFAGYHFGEDPLPRDEISTSVIDFGANGTDKLDDTQAFKDAIESTERGVILIPPGRYIISDILWIEKPNITLRGEGPEKSVLWVPVSLDDVRPNPSSTTSGRPTSGYSWSGGFLWVKGQYPQTASTPIVSKSERAEQTITVADASLFAPGQRVMIEMHDDDAQTLFNHLYAGDPGDTRNVTRPTRARMGTRIKAINGNEVTIERPLRWDIRLSWSPTLRPFTPTVTEVGIEDLGIEFPSRPYQGHFTEVGYNAIAITKAADCWLRNVRITNSDSGVFISGMFCTVDELTIDSTRAPNRGATGHHGVSMGTDCVLQNFDFRTHFIHDITVSREDAGNVVKNGGGINLSLDHHKHGNYENLFCNLHLGRGAEMWRSGGGAALGKHCGARTTFWCIRADRNQSWPPSGFAPDLINLIGVQSGDESHTGLEGRWFEAIDPEQLTPPDLHAAQLQRRLAAQGS